MLDTKDVFARHGVRWTRQRMDLYQTLAGTKCHPTAEQLHRMVCEHLPEPSLATVYNTLDLFARTGLCRKINTGAGGARYDADTSHHLHLVTPEGGLMDVPEDLSQAILAGISRDAITQLERRLEVRIGRIEVQLTAV